MTCMLDRTSLFGLLEVLEREADVVDHALQKNDYVVGQGVTLAKIDDHHSYVGFAAPDGYRGTGMYSTRDRDFPPRLKSRVGLEIV